MYFCDGFGVLLVFLLGVVGAGEAVRGFRGVIPPGGYTTATHGAREWLKFPKIIKRPYLR